MAGCRLIVAALTVMSIARSLARSTPIICRGWPISVRSCSPPMARLFATAEHSSADTDAATDTVPNTVNHSNNQAEQTNYYTEFLDNRPWERAEQFWREMVPITDVHALPAFVRGTTFMRNDIDFTTGSRYGNSDDEYGVTDLRPLYAAGEKGEFFSADYRYCKRHTYAMRIGYVGTEFYGYQMQNGSNVTTVEGDIRDVIGKSGYAAGRTDRGVSALSQIVGFVTDKVDFDIDAFISKVRNSEPCQSGRLAIYECVRVPKKFNARSEATWRRYLYLIPLNSLAEVTDTAIPSDEPVVDVKLMNSILQRLEGKQLPYNGFAYKEDRLVGQGLKDLCTLYRAKASLVNISSSDNSDTTPAVSIELVGSRFLRRMVRNIAATSLREALIPPADVAKVSLADELSPDDPENILVKLCEIGDRTLIAPSLPGEPLCFAGVGFDTIDLAKYKFKPKLKLQELEAEIEQLLNNKE